MDGGTWWATVHGVAKSRTGLSDFTLTFSLFNKYLLYTLYVPCKVLTVTKVKPNSCSHEACIEMELMKMYSH